MKVYELSLLSCPANRLYVSVTDSGSIQTNLPTQGSFIETDDLQAGPRGTVDPQWQKRLNLEALAQVISKTMTVGVSHALLWV